MFWPIDEIRNAVQDAFSWAVQKVFHFAVEVTDTSDRIQRRVDHETAERTLDPDVFRTDFFKEEAKRIREEKSEEGTPITKWLDGFFAPFVGKSAPETVIQNMGIDTEKLPQQAKAMLGMMNMMADATVLANYLETIGGVIPLDINIPALEFLMSISDVSGMQEMLGFGMGEMMGDALTPPIQYGIYDQNPPLIPNQPDLTRFQVKEVYKTGDQSIEEISKRAQKHVGDPTAWVDMPTWRGKQLVPYPPKRYFENMRKQGFDRSWAEDYWAAHWEEPSFRRAREMWARLSPDVLEGIEDDYFEVLPEGVEKTPENVHKYVDFDTSDMRRLLRFRDVNPYWRSKLAAISKRPYTRVDLRRMYERGVFKEDLSAEEVDETIEKLSEQDPQFDAMYRGFREIRFPKRKALRMAQFYIKWANREIIDQKKEDILFDFRRGVKPEEETRKQLNRLLERPELVDVLISHAKKEGPPATPTKKELKTWFERYTAPDIDEEPMLSEDEVRQYLEWEGYEPKIIDKKIAAWRYKGGKEEEKS